MKDKTDMRGLIGMTTITNGVLLNEQQCKQIVEYRSR